MQPICSARNTKSARLFRALLAGAPLISSLILGHSACENPSATTKDETETPYAHGLTAEQANSVLVKIGERSITLGEFAARLADQSPYLQARYQSPERRRDFLENMIRFELLALEAERRGMTQLPSVQRAQKQMMVEQMMIDRFENRLELSNVGEDEIRAHYEAHASEYQKPAQVRASHILIRDRSAAMRTLKQLTSDPDNADLFLELAQKRNEDSRTKERFGDLRFLFKPEDQPDAPQAVADEVIEAAFRIEEIGGIYPELVQSAAGFHIIKLTGRREALSRSLEEVRRPLQHRLWREKREKAVESLVQQLRAQAHIEVDEEVLAQIQIVEDRDLKAEQSDP